jgi:hypothetical protein
LSTRVCWLVDTWTTAELDRKFSGAKSELGPAVRMEARIYGSDIHYPLPPNVTSDACLVIQLLLERLESAVVKRTGSSASDPAKEERVIIGQASR